MPTTPLTLTVQRWAVLMLTGVARMLEPGREPIRDDTRDRGQATTEYALVMLAAALVALLVVAWATAGGGAGKIGQLFDRILDEVIGRV